MRRVAVSRPVRLVFSLLSAATFLVVARPSNAAPSANAAPATPDATAKPIEEVDGYLKIGFDRLSGYTFNPAPFDPAKPNSPPPSSADQIPDRIKQLDGKKAVITGFMLPTQTSNGLVTELLLLKDPMMCCYGVTPQMNEWVIVKLKKGVRALQDVPLAFYGTLHVKEIFDAGYLSGIYQLDAEKMAQPK